MSEHQFIRGQRGGRLVGEGRVLAGEEFREYCEKHGLCTICGQVPVKKKKGIRRSWSDIEASLTPSGEIEVYKGYHISPRCYSLNQARAALGEIAGLPQDGLSRSLGALVAGGPPQRSHRDERALPHIPEASDTYMTSGRVNTGSELFSIGLPSTGDASTQAPQPIYWSPPSSQKARTRRMLPTEDSDPSLYRNVVATGDMHTQSPNAPGFPLRNVPESSSEEFAVHVHSASSDNVAGLASSPPAWNRNVASAGDLSRRPTEESARRKLSASSEKVVTLDANGQRSAQEATKNVASYGHAHAQSSSTPCPPFGNIARASCTSSPPTSSSDDTPEAHAIHELEQLASRLDVYQFLAQLDGYGSKLVIVRRGLQLMRELVLAVHRQDPERKYVFPNDSWCKIIKSAMTDHGSDTSMQEEGAETITLVCSLSIEYTAELIKNHSSRELIAAMATHPSVVESCCVALECLTRTDGTSVRWREEHAETAFESINTVLSNPSNSGASYAILALHNLTCHENFRPEFVEDHMRVIFADDGVMATFSAVIQDFSVAEEVAEALISLLKRYWIRFKNDPDEESTVAPSSDDLLGTLMGTLYSCGSNSFHEEICGLFSCFKFPISADADDSLWKQTLSGIHFSMMSHTTVESVQLAGLSALCNLFGDSSRREEHVTDLDEIVEVVVFAMKNYSRNAELQALGCIALALICSRGDWCKEAVVHKGGIVAVSNAFRSHVIDIDPDSAPANDVTVAACSVIGSLALSSAALSELQQSSLLVDFRKMIERDGSSLEQPSVRSCVMNLFAVSFMERDDARSSSDDESGYSSLAETVRQFLWQSQIEEGDVQTLLVSLNTICSRAASALNVIMFADDGAGLRRIVHFMETYQNNATIQEAGCAILANSYFYVPFEGELHQSTFRSIGTDSMHVKTHSRLEIAALSAALDNHTTNAEVVKNASEALSNFVCGLNVVASDPGSVRFAEDVVVLFSAVASKVLSTISAHGENVEVLRPLLRLLLVSACVLGDEGIQRRPTDTINRLFDIMIRFPHDQEIHEYACRIIARIVALDDDRIDASVATSATSFRALLHSLRMENEAVISCATAIIASFVRSVSTLRSDVVEIEEFMSCLVGCMFRHQECADIQAASCSILASLATNDYYTMVTIANEGVPFQALIFAMRTHRDQPYVLEYASRALCAVSEGIPDDSLRSARVLVCEELLEALKTHANAEGVSGSTLEALCRYCRRDDYFILQVAEVDVAPLVVDVMSQHLQSEDLQTAGCTLFRLLASKNDENKRNLGEAGAVRALTTAMLAHIRSTDIQKEALKALKHISRVSSNKETFRINDVSHDIMLAAQANFENPQIVSAALSALHDIVVDTLTQQVNPVSEEILKLVMQAMKIHVSEVDVQKAGCYLVGTYGYNDRNLTEMRRFKDELYPLLLTASHSYPEECWKHIRYVLERL